MSKTAPVRLDDPDDCRPRRTPARRRLLVLGGVVLGFVLLAAYLFAPAWSYLVLVPAGMALYFRHDRRFASERDRIGHYLARIPPGERLAFGKFRQRIGIPRRALDAVVAEFPDLCTPDGDGTVSADTMYNTVICWYYRNVKGRAPDEVRRLVLQRTAVSRYPPLP